MTESRTPGSIGVIGCGAVAQGPYVETLPRLAGIRIDCVSDINSDAADKLARKLRSTVADIETMCQRVETVIVATPPSTHRQLVGACLERGVHVVCEKPFVGKVEHAEELIAIARRCGVRLRVGHFRRTFPTVNLVRELVGTGAFGAVRAIRVAEGGRFSWVAESGYVSADPCGGVLYDTGSHAVDMALYASGLDDEKFTVRVGQVGRDRPEPAHEIRASFTTEHGDKAVDWDVRLSRFESLANRIQIECESARFDLPVGPREHVRLTGRGGSRLLRVDGFVPYLGEYFLRQWQATLLPSTSTMFEAEHFVGLTRILASVGGTESAP